MDLEGDKGGKKARKLDIGVIDSTEFMKLIGG